MLSLTGRSWFVLNPYHHVPLKSELLLGRPAVTLCDRRHVKEATVSEECSDCSGLITFSHWGSETNMVCLL